MISDTKDSWPNVDELRALGVELKVDHLDTGILNMWCPPCLILPKGCSPEHTAKALMNFADRLRQAMRPN